MQLIGLYEQPFNLLLHTEKQEHYTFNKRVVGAMMQLNRSV